MATTPLDVIAQRLEKYVNECNLKSVWNKATYNLTASESPTEGCLV